MLSESREYEVRNSDISKRPASAIGENATNLSTPPIERDQTFNFITELLDQR